MKRPDITPGPWSYSYTSAAQARKDALAEGSNTDGGGADGQVSYGTSYGKRAVVFLPHHRDPKEDGMRGANAKAIAALPDTLIALEKLLVCLEDFESNTFFAEEIKAGKDALAKAGYTF